MRQIGARGDEITQPPDLCAALDRGRRGPPAQSAGSPSGAQLAFRRTDVADQWKPDSEDHRRRVAQAESVARSQHNATVRRNRHSITDPNQRNNTYANPDTDTNSNTYTDSNTYACADTDTNSKTYACPDTDRYTNTKSDTSADACSLASADLSEPNHDNAL